MRSQLKPTLSWPQVLVEKSIKGWREAEYEVVRDAYDNCVTVRMHFATIVLRHGWLSCCVFWQSPVELCFCIACMHCPLSMALGARPCF